MCAYRRTCFLLLLEPGLLDSSDPQFSVLQQLDQQAYGPKQAVLVKDLFISQDRNPL